MAASGYNPVFLRAWENTDNETIDDVVKELNENDPPKEGQKPRWDKAGTQKEAARYRQKGVNLRKFGRPRVLDKIVADEANKFLESLHAPADEGEEEQES